MSSNKTTVHPTKYLKPARKTALLGFRKKYAEKLLGLCDDDVRLPLVKVTDATKEIVKKALQSAKLI